MSEKSNNPDVEVGREVEAITASPPDKNTKTKQKKAKKRLLEAIENAHEFSIRVTRTKYNSTDTKCNANCIAFVAYELDEKEKK